MENWTCDICGGSLVVGLGGCVSCKACGIEYSAERVQEKLQNMSLARACQALSPLVSDPEESANPLLIKAFDIILENGSASASLLQRKLKIGYAQAARLLDEMEEKKMIGPYTGSVPRKICMSAQQWEVMKQEWE